MDTQYLVYRLRENLPEGVKLKQSRPDSKWSLSITPEIGEPPHEALRRIFKIDIPDWKEKFDEAISGPGREKNRILTLHSCALLALLCFSHVSEENPVCIEGVMYTERWFEVKNKVFNSPSSVDVVLKSKEGDLLFIESKFTEYLDRSTPGIKMRYFDTYRRLLPLIPDSPLQLVFPKIIKQDNKEVVGFTIQPTSKSKKYEHLYLSGIKQCISHLMGIANGPVNPAERCWAGINNQKIRFATICYRVNRCEQFKAYRDFYAATIG